MCVTYHDHRSVYVGNGQERTVRPGALLRPTKRSSRTVVMYRGALERSKLGKQLVDIRFRYAKVQVRHHQLRRTAGSTEGSTASRQQTNSATTAAAGSIALAGTETAVANAGASGATATRTTIRATTGPSGTATTAWTARFLRLDDIIKAHLDFVNHFVSRMLKMRRRQEVDMMRLLAMLLLSMW
uniref:Uncharacterized protein n=1 Tax=Anopheles farauti TaxID=69004 RepID=A0A182Q2K5_9DIPT